MIYNLKEPIMFGSEKIDSLEVQDVKAKHMRDLPSNPNTGDMLDLLQKLTGRPKTVIDELSVRDVTQLFELVGKQLGDIQ
jgi:trehalose-6-phosphatase